MSRVYKCLPASEYADGDYSLTPIRDEDKYAIMQWRNEQIDILRQNEHLTVQQQEHYFATVVDPLFEQQAPKQLLFSFFERTKLVGYGGLVHIDWLSRNGEISFITETQRSRDKSQFVSDWMIYLDLLKKMVRAHLGFVKIYTYAYDMRPLLFNALQQSDFQEEARLKNHIQIKNQWLDVRIHSYFFESVTLRLAVPSDARLYFDWANDPAVRENSFNTSNIEWSVHENWFSNKLKDHNALLLVALLEGIPAGQIRFDKVSDVFEVDFSVDPTMRGRGLGRAILKRGAEALAFSKPGAKRILGKVKKTNIPSQKAFLNAGYQTLETAAEQSYTTFHSDLTK